MSNQQLADLATIRELACRYAQSVDRHNWQLMRELFSADSTMLVPHLELDMQGIDAIVAGIEPIKDMFKRTLHCVMNQTVEFSDNGATAETYCVANHIYDDEQGVERKMDMGIRYQDELVQENGEWRIKKRTLNLDWQQDLPLQG